MKKLGLTLSFALALGVVTIGGASYTIDNGPNPTKSTIVIDNGPNPTRVKANYYSIDNGPNPTMPTKNYVKGDYSTNRLLIDNGPNPT
jgi:ABC-type antimicrobial peptide transport system permease subunit